MRKRIVLFALFLAFFSCTKDSEELKFDNPLDKDGTNWHAPVIDTTYFSDTLIPINDTLYFTIKADPQDQHDALDSAFYYDGETFDTVGAKFDNGYASLPVSKKDSGNYTFDYWISDKVGRRNEAQEMEFRVDLFNPGYLETDTKNFRVASGENLEIDLAHYTKDENGEIKKYFYSIDTLTNGWTEQDSSLITPKWSIEGHDSQLEYNGNLFIKVRDDDSLESEVKQITITVTYSRPIIEFEDSIKLKTSNNHNFTVGAHDKDNDIVKFLWSVNKDNPDNNFSIETEEPVFDTTFTEEGIYFIKVKAIDKGNVESYEQVQKVEVSSEVEEPTLTIDGSSTINNNVGDKVTLTVIATPAMGKTIEEFKWSIPTLDTNFTTNENSISRVFEKAATYEVIVQAVDNEGVYSNEVTFTINISGNDIKPTVSITNPVSKTTEVFRDEEIMIEAKYNSPDGTELDRFEWFINGNIIHQSDQKSNTLTRTYDTYDLKTKNVIVTVKAIDIKDRESDLDTCYVILKDGRPTVTEVSWIKVPIVTIQPNTTIEPIQAGKEVVFRASAKDSNPNGTIKKIIWSFRKEGDQNETVVPKVFDILKPENNNFLTRFDTPGLYDMTVEAVDDDELTSDAYSFRIRVE